jgi:hypothetical protein
MHRHVNPNCSKKIFLTVADNAGCGNGVCYNLFSLLYLLGPALFCVACDNKGILGRVACYPIYVCLQSTGRKRKKCSKSKTTRTRSRSRSRSPLRSRSRSPVCTKFQRFESQPQCLGKRTWRWSNINQELGEALANALELFSRDLVGLVGEYGVSVVFAFSVFCFQRLLFSSS